MKRYERLKKRKPEEFKGLVGVKLETFAEMLKVSEKAYEEKKAKGGRPNKLSISDQLLLMLEYYREYRTMAHMAFDYSISEPK